MCYKNGCSTIEANKFQPDCCISLVFAWMTRMSKSTIVAEKWCSDAHKAGDNSEFYKNHIIINRAINGVTRLQNIKKAQMIGEIIAKHGREKMDVGVVKTAKNIIEAMSEPIMELKKDVPLQQYLRRIKAEIVGECSENCEKVLQKEIMILSPKIRYYLLRYKATKSSHAVGLVSTKDKGVISPKGYLYYYDPNLNCVAKWRSRDDLKLFLQKTAKDYKGMSLIRKVEFK